MPRTSFLRRLALVAAVAFAAQFQLYRLNGWLDTRLEHADARPALRRGHGGMADEPGHEGARSHRSGHSRSGHARPGHHRP